MQSIRKKIAVSASLLMATAGVVASVQTASPATSAPPISARQKATVSVSIVPGIIGPGAGLQSSKKANWAVIAKYGAGKVGKKVVLQRKSGSTWVTADKAVVDKKGNVVFAVPYPGSKVVTYRVDGPGSASAPVSTDGWGTDADFVDEFGGSRLNLDHWNHRQAFYQIEAKRECSKGDPKAVKVSGGSAKLSVLVDKKRNALCKPKKPGKNVVFGKFKYRLNANIGTQYQHSITYGVVSARIKFQPLQGQHASLWMQPENLNGSTNPKRCRHRDRHHRVVRQGRPQRRSDELRLRPRHPAQEDLPWGSAGGGWVRKPEQYLENKKDDWYKRYHVFSVEWNPSGYIFRIDGKETGRINKAVSGVPEYPILSLLSSDYELAKLPEPGREEEPAPDHGGGLDPHLAGPGSLHAADAVSHAVRPRARSPQGDRASSVRSTSPSPRSNVGHSRLPHPGCVPHSRRVQEMRLLRSTHPPETTWRNRPCRHVPPDVCPPERSRRPIAAALVALVASTAVAAVGQTSEAAPQQATITVLPGIVQPGKKVANADKALSAVVATFAPAKKGREVVLQKKVRQQVGRRRRRRPGQGRQGRVRRPRGHRDAARSPTEPSPRRAPASVRSRAARSPPRSGARRRSPTSSRRRR